MIGEARPLQRRKHVIGKNKIARIGEVVRDIGLPHLSIGQHGPVQVPVCYQVETVHLASVDCPEGVPPTMANVKCKSVRTGSERNYSALGRPAHGDSVSPGKSAKVSVERAILLDDKYNMLNLRQPFSFRRR